MLQFFAWYVAITILGLLTFPLAYRLLPALADRGYALSRSLGLLVWGFVFWLAVSLGLSQNNVGGLLLALLVVVGLSVWANWRADREADAKDSVESSTPRPAQGKALNFQQVVDWFKNNWRYVLNVEVLFFIAFAFLAFVRANNPELVGTEKPMEMAFINAIMRSPTFPPHDPWLSGYAISYYYFGYVMTAMLAEITATVGSVAFNLMIALIFGLSAIGAYGLLYNLCQAYWQSKGANRKQSSDANATRSMSGALLAPLFLLVLGNWEGLLEIFHKRGWGWTVNSDGSFGLPAPFWTWLNMQDLRDAPSPVLGGIIERLLSWWAAEGFNGLGKWFIEAFMPERNWWWWRASRVVNDYELRNAFKFTSEFPFISYLSGNLVEVIDEFPFFSYLLGDLHPHVLAMPFGLLVGALALNLFLGGWQGETRLFKLKLSDETDFDLSFPVRLDGFILLAVALGGLAFLNTWDLPIYLAVVCGAFVLMLVRSSGWCWDLVEKSLKFLVPLTLLGVVLYLPFYLGFSSQAGGIMPNVIFPTRGAALWIMFGGLFVPIFVFLFYLLGKEKVDWFKGFALSIGFTLFLWALSIGLGIVTANTDAGRQFVSDQGFSSTLDILREATQLRLLYGASLLTLVILIGTAAAYLTATRADGSQSERTDSSGSVSPIPFVLMFTLVGGLLVLAPEFVYLRDQFGSRMNTVFKFYYEAWAMWSVVAAFGVVVMLSELRSLASWGYTVLIFVLVAIGLIYPVLGITNRTNSFNVDRPEQRSLDGAAYLMVPQDAPADWPNEYGAIQFLAQAAPGTIVEAVGGSYRGEYELAATYSGLPTVLGWPGHESQWRGGAAEMGNREEDIRTLYTTHDWEQAQAILKQYGIRYIYIGPIERQTYQVYDDKFAQHLSKVYDYGQVVIYIVP